MTRGNSAVKGGLWMATTGVASQALSFVVFIILARMLDPAAYGLIALSMTVILVLIAGSRLGLEKLLVQLDSPGKIETDTAFLCTAMLGALLALLLWLASPLMAGLVNTPELAPVMRALAPVVALKALEAVPLGLMVRESRFKAVALGTILALAAGGATGIAMAGNGYGVWALVGQELVKAVCSLTALCLACGWRPGFAVSVKTARRMLAASLHIMGAEMTRIAQNHADRLLIGSLLGATSLGTYTIAAKVNQAASTVLLDSLSRVGLPTLSRARNDPARLKTVYYQSQRIGAAVTLPLFVLLLLTAPLVVPLLLGPQWQASVPILQVLCLASCAGSLGVFNAPLLLAAGRPDIVFRLSVYSAITGLAAGLVAIPLGIMAVSLAFALRAWLMLPLELALCARYCAIPTGPVRTALARQSLTLLPMVLVVWGFQPLALAWPPWLALLGSVSLGMAVYVAALIVADRALLRTLLTIPAMAFRRDG